MWGRDETGGAFRSNPLGVRVRITNMNLRPASLVLIGLLALTACGGDDTGANESAAITASSTTTATNPTADATIDDAAATADAARVTISRSRFDNVELRVPAGTTVVFENTDPFAHTITSTDASPVEFDSGEIGQDETFEFTFDESGEYAYFCRIHPTMRAVVIVG
jgi:plastocyanin